MWASMLDRMLRELVHRGDLEIRFPDGRTRRYGDGNEPSLSLRFTDPDLPRKLLFHPDMALGEGYMDGTIEIENDALHELLGLLMANLSEAPANWRDRLLHMRNMFFRRLQQFNPVRRAKANVAHHYDLSGELYDLFLDRDHQYSCAYFPRPGMTLEEAQEAKKAHIAGKLLIERDMRVLDIGCGWGGMALTLARDHGARVLGVTLSEEQFKVARARAEKAGLSDRVEFRLCDYRALTGKFDRVVSVGMFEHVGTPHYRTYFRNVHDRLAVDGVALIHTIGRVSPPGGTSPWITKYIFPGGYVPALSETMAAIERENFWSTDVEVWRLHYAETLHHWYERFMANIERARELYDDRFCRMWRYYLAASEMGFRHYGQVVFQIQLAHRQEAVPLTRDYLYRTEAAPQWRAAE